VGAGGVRGGACRAASIAAAVAIDAAQLRFEGDPADRVIYATARATDALLVTRDERLRSFDPKLTVW
jgi:PIN domain nuclease of toxin-antitoxin system